MYEILINVLVFSGILLLLALTVAVVQGILILVDTRKMTKEVGEKVKAIVSVVDIVTMFLAGISGLKNKARGSANLTAAVAGIKKGLQVFLNKEEGK